MNGGYRYVCELCTIVLSPVKDSLTDYISESTRRNLKITFLFNNMGLLSARVKLILAWLCIGPMPPTTMTNSKSKKARYASKVSISALLLEKNGDPRLIMARTFKDTDQGAMEIWNPDH